MRELPGVTSSGALLVRLHVALHNVETRAEEPLEGVSLEKGDPDVFAFVVGGIDTRRARLVLDERHLAEVGRRRVAHDLLFRRAAVVRERHAHAATLDEVQAVGVVALPDDARARRERPRRQRVGQVHALVRLERVEHRQTL